MAAPYETGDPVREIVAPKINWAPIFLGAAVASALSAILLSFAIALGLGVASAAPTWRDSSAVLAILSGVYLIIQAAISFGVGGYVTGRTLPTDGWTGDLEQRDGVHGLGAWALAVLFGAVVAAMASNALPTHTSTARAAETSAAEPLLSYELDRLFRPVRRTAPADLSAERAEAGRILLTTSSHSGVAPEDRTYLVSLVAGATGLSGPDAERRVDTTLANARLSIQRTRRTAVILAFSVATALMLGAAIAWASAAVGGRHRNGAAVPRWLNSRRLGRA